MEKNTPQKETLTSSNSKEMSSTTAFNGRTHIDPNETETPFLTPIRPSSSCHSTSLSSPPSSLSSDSTGSLMSFPDDSPPFSLSTPFRFSGVPFSWEQLPGIPKKISPKKKVKVISSTNLLPLPPAPAGTTTTPIPSRKSNREETAGRLTNNTRRNYTISEGFRKDPFFAALVECSKDHHDQDTFGNFYKGGGSKFTRNISCRFGFFSTVYTSCKRTCAVSESIIHLPKV